MNKTLNKWLMFIKYFLIIAVVLEVALFFILAIIEQRINKIRYDDIALSERKVVQLEVSMSSLRFNSVIEDLFALCGSLQNSTAAGVPLAVTAENWRRMAAQKSTYSNIIFTDPSGIPVIHAENSIEKGALLFKNSPPMTVPRVEKGYVHVGIIHMDSETVFGRKKEYPVINFFAGVYGPDKQFLGTVRISYYVDTYLHLFRDIGESTPGQMYLVNSAGGWITRPNEETYLGFAKSGDIKSFAMTYPDEWAVMTTEDHGQITTGNGMFTFDKGNLRTDPSGAIPRWYHKITAEEGRWHIISHITPNSALGNLVRNENLMDTVWDLMTSRWLLFMFVIALAAGAAMLETTLVWARRDVEFHSSHDTLTGLMNRRVALKKLQGIFQNKRHRAEDVFSVCFIDVNGLKDINDNLGHDYGDELILTVATVLSHNTRERDFAARIGGDEFILVLPGTDTETAKMVWSRVIEEIDRINQTETRPYLISISCGMEDSDGDFGTVDDILRSADAKMYEEKRILKQNLHVLHKRPEDKS